VPALNKISPQLWFVKEAEEAAKFYVSLFPDSRIDRVWTMASETPSGPPGSVTVVEFTLAGLPFGAMSAGELDPFNHAISFMVLCEDQAEIDRYHAAFAEGGRIEDCGWVADRFGVCWQIAPAVLSDLMADPDRAKAARVARAMLTMKKLDLAALQAAARG
jgi:predicted 3-demethylubiquinone-9 3-methyltransferase (glyoxalase superfamily)